MLTNIVELWKEKRVTNIIFFFLRNRNSETEESISEVRSTLSYSLIDQLCHCVMGTC